MNNRQEHILNIVINEHITTGVPVGSGVLVKKYDLDVSPATVRNEMSELEKQGYIAQPHTSAGRIPTELAYQWLVDRISKENIENENGKRALLDSKEESDVDFALNNLEEVDLKQTAKVIAEISGLAVFWAFHRNNVYYTGICNLLQQPEFARNDLMYDMSAMVDRIDEIVNDVFDDIDHNAKALLGEESPFGSFSGTVVTKYKTGEHQGLFGVLGPVRMDYAKNLNLINYIKSKLK